jgi:hypothetical protein
MRAFEKTRFLISALGSVLALSGCFLENDKTAGVDDFPNSIYARVDGFLEESKKAESLEGTPGTDSLLIRQSFNAPPVPKVSASASLPPLAKRSASAAACPATITISEAKAPIGTRVTVDTLSVCMDSLWLDPIKGNEHIVRGKSVTRDTATGRLEIGEFTDADGDGFLNPNPGGASKVRLLFIVTDKGVTERTEMVVGFGPDNDLATEADNLIHLLQWSKTQGADTLGAAAYADADSDGVVIDNAKPSLVDVTWYAQGPTEDDETARWSRFRMRTWAVYGVKSNRPVRFSAESESGDGRLNTAVILAADGDETFDLADTVVARFQAVGTAPADSVDTLRTTLRIKLGDFDAKADDTTYALRVMARKKLGEEVRADFDFVSDKPIPHGREPEVGTLTMRVEYADATFLDVAGKITETTVDVTATLRDGKRLHAVWDREGNGISLEHLD